MNENTKQLLIQEVKRKICGLKDQLKRYKEKLKKLEKENE